MLLIIDEDSYTLELGYDFEFTEQSYLEILWDVVNCFCDNDEMTLFGYTEYDKDLSECKEEMTSGYSEEEFQELIKPRISFISTEWYFPPEYSLHFEQPDDFIRTLWVNLKGKSEVVKWLNKDSWFICIILEKGKPLSEYNYYLTYKEMEPEPTMVLEIVERRKGHFMNIVLPRLQKIFNNQIKGGQFL
ncbi:hypothetical protein R9X47_24370 [Wukongibacter baidiensis]|uniref:hypothetical protein n=1 Tax=Wukongibacter baidiensis TaxID=1723361 RepID=UPI003D7FC62A